MKGFNVFLAVLIFLLAAVSAVFSYFLFEKRGQLVGGWNDMAGKISATAIALDKNSGTNVAETLTPEAMHQTKYAELGELLPKLPEQAGQVIAERDALANSLSKIGNTLEKSDLPAGKFQNLSSYAEALSALEAYVNAYQARNNAILNKVSQSASCLGTSVSVNELKSSSYSSIYGKIDERIRYIMERVTAFSRSVDNIARLTEDTPAPGFSSDNRQGEYASKLSAVVSGVQKLRNDLDQTRSDLQNARQKIKSHEQTIADLKAQISKLNSVIDEKNAEIKSLRKAMGMEVDAPIPLNDGCVESLKMVRDQSKGRVTDIDDKFGFFVISLGSKTLVQEPVGNYVNQVNPMIPVGAELVIARDIPGSDPEYIGKLKLVKLGEKYSIAELLDNSSGKRPKVGDAVYFSDEEIEKIVKSRK